MRVGPLDHDEPIDLATGQGLAATYICGTRGHPGFGRTMADCEREVRRLERGGGVGQWLVAVKQDHRAALEPLRPPPYAPNLDLIRWIEDHRHGPSRPRRLSCLWACPHREPPEPPGHGCACGQLTCPGCRHGAWLDRARRRFLAAQGKPPRLPLPWRTRVVLAAIGVVNRLAARLVVADHPEAARRLWQVTGLWD